MRDESPHSTAFQLYAQGRLCVVDSALSAFYPGDKMYKKLTLAVLTAFSTMALADINVGVSLSATGPAASLGIPEKNTIALLPTTIGGQKVNYIVLDDATDPTAATKNIKKLISENKVDVVIGSTTTPNSLAMMDVAVDNETPLISMAGSAIVVEPMDAKRHWVSRPPRTTPTWQRRWSST